jgi:hypothetical protein
MTKRNRYLHDLLLPHHMRKSSCPNPTTLAIVVLAMM